MIRKFLKLITNNLAYKIIAVLIAVFLWFFAQGEKTAEVTLKVPIIINTLSADNVVINKVPRYIELILSGPSSAIFGYAKEKPVYRINLLKRKVGNYIFNISPYKFNLPDRVKVQGIYPGNITISLDKIVNKVVDVGVTIVGSPPPGNTLKGIITEPDKVTIMGPSTIVSGINTIMTIPVDISKFVNNISLMVPLSMARYKMVKVQPRAVVVVFKVGK